MVGGDPTAEAASRDGGRESDGHERRALLHAQVGWRLTQRGRLTQRVGDAVGWCDGAICKPCPWRVLIWFCGWGVDELGRLRAFGAGASPPAAATRLHSVPSTRRWSNSFRLEGNSTPHVRQVAGVPAVGGGLLAGSFSCFGLFRLPILGAVIPSFLSMMLAVLTRQDVGDEAVLYWQALSTLV